MKTPMLASLAVIAAVSPAFSGTFEVLASQAAAPFAVSFQAFKFSPAKLALKGAAFAAASVSVLDIERLYNAGAKVEKGDLQGWFAGRRYSAKGVSAQLLVGADILKDPAAGSLGGADFKLAAFGGAQPDVIGVEYYDEPGSETLNTVSWIIHEEGAKWKTAEFRQTGATGQDSRDIFEIRKSDNLLVAKYADGTYAYFFKKVR